MPTCVKCGEQATYKITKILNGEIKDLYFCENHAADFSPYLREIQQPQGSQVDHDKLVELLQSFLKHQQEEGATEDVVPGEMAQAVCPNCGLEFGAYRKTLLLGCSDCYEAFELQLLDDLRKMHGATRHYGHTTEHEEEDIPESAPPLAEIQPVPPGEAAQAIEEAMQEPETEEIPVEFLEEQMQEAIKSEDFHRAAELRDEIRRRKAEESETPDA